MSDQELQFEQIEQYLNKEMSEAEAEQFEAQMKADAQLREMVQLHRDMAIAIMDEEETELENKLKQINREFQSARQSSQKRPFRLHNTRLWLVAASVAVLTMLAIWYFRPSQAVSFSNEELYAQHFTPYDDFGDVRGADSSLNEILNSGFEFYKDKDYAQALARFMQVPESNEAFIRTQFFRGICEMETGKINEAIAHFEQVIQNGNTLLTEQAQWYQALAYLKLGERNQAKTLLEQLKDAAAAGRELRTKTHKLYEQL